MIPFIKKYSQDKSWRIRYLVADKIMDISKGIGADNTHEHLVQYYLTFLQDSESEVRTAAVRKLEDFG